MDQKEFEHDEKIEKKRIIDKRGLEVWYKRPDFQLWFGGIVFIVILSLLIFICGGARDWDADSYFTHNTSKTSRDRFWQKPLVDEPGVHRRHGVGASIRWYYWQLPPPRATAWTRLFVWFCYVTHQLFVWAVIYANQLQKLKEPISNKYTSYLSPYNWTAFGINAFFHVLHLVQTHSTYDATAQDVSEASSQGSVIMMLVFILFIEYKDRGLFMGWPTVSNKDKFSSFLRLNYGPTNLTRKYHGYAFAWAAIYTFWYHPMENTFGHVTGFAHTWLLMLQGSLMYTNWHLNRYWKLLLEVWVILHGGIVAVQTGGPAQLGTRLWPLFVFGFSIVFALIQIFSLPFWKRIPFWTRPIPIVVLFGFMTYAFSWIPDAQGRVWVRYSEIIYIPITYYLYFIVGWAFMMIFLKIEEKCASSTATPPSRLKNAMYLIGSFLIYVIMVVISWMMQFLDVKLHLIPLMLILVGIFSVGVSISQMFFKYSFPPRSSKIKSISNDILDSKQNGDINAMSDKVYSNGAYSPTDEPYYHEKKALYM